MSLTKKQRLFIENYLTCFNATKAARDAGYSEKTAHSQGHRLLRHAEVAEAIRQRLENAHMTAEEALALAAEKAREGNPRLIELMLKHHGLLTDRVEVTTDGEIRVKLEWPDGNGNDNAA